jgi:hypothetical protein
MSRCVVKIKLHNYWNKLNISSKKRRQTRKSVDQDKRSCNRIARQPTLTNSNAAQAHGKAGQAWPVKKLAPITVIFAAHKTG